MKRTLDISSVKRARAILIAAALLGFAGTATALAGEAQLSVANVSVPEGNSGITQMNFSVVRSGDSSTNITVPYSVPPGTADPKNDYVRPANNTVLRIPAGFTQGIVSVPVNGDRKVEPNETVRLQLGQPAAYSAVPAFAETPAYIVGSLPQGSVAADFNGDGVLDLATADVSDDVVSVLLGDGSGSFRKAKEYPAGKARSLATADFNGDGRPDLAIPNYETNTVSILFGDGRGGFGETASYAAGIHPDAVATGDFNGDGRLDLAVANEGDPFVVDSNVSVFLGTGSGGLDTAMSFRLDHGPAAVTVADLNGDGISDLVVAYLNSNDVSILMGRGNGRFRAATNIDGGLAAASTVIGDFNRDGKPDLAVANRLGVRVLRGLGNGGFGAPVDIAIGNLVAPAIVATDFGQDGKLDLAVTDRSTNNVAILIGDGAGNFVAGRTFRITKSPRAITTADFNGDGRPDLAVVAGTFSSHDNTVSILLGIGDDNFAATESYVVGTYPGPIVSADFNQDGIPDLATVNSAGDIPILLGTITGEFASAASISIGRSIGAIATADFNGDGRADLLVTTSAGTGTEFLVLLGNGGGSFGTPAPFNLDDGAYYTAVVIADFNGDGETDIASTFSGGIAILLGNGHAGFAPAMKFAINSYLVDASLATADLNGDGRLDLVVPITNLRDSDSHAFAVMLGDGNGRFGQPSMINSGTRSTSRFAIGDLNGDGTPDLAQELSGEPYLAVLTGDGTGGFGVRRTFYLGRDGYPGGNVAIVDFNGDGARDIALITRAKRYGLNDDTVSILVNDGSGNFGVPVTIAGGSLSALLAVDLNGDGKRDIAATNGQNGTLEVFFNSPGNSAVLSSNSAIGTILNDD